MQTMKKSMKYMGVLFISLLMMAMMAMPTLAAGTLKITGLQAGDKVTLYKIGSADTSQATGVKFITGVSFNDPTQPTSQEINGIAAKLQAGTLTADKAVDAQAVAGTEFTYTPNEASVYIAVVESANDKLYNPMILAANMKDTGLTDATVDSGSTYGWGETAIAKSKTPGVEKTAETGKPDQNTAGDTIQTGEVGDRVSYSLTADLPGYPANATNKTMYVADTMSAGLTFEYDSLTIEWNGKTLKADAAGEFKDGATLIAKAKETGNGFNLSFDYDNLDNKQPIVKYTAVINDKAVIGATGNKNDVKYFYSNNPTKGNTHDDVNNPPQEGNGIVKKEDSKKVYTYEIAFKKTDDQTNNPKALEGAIFGVYSDEACTKLVDTVETNEKGMAATAKVGKGTYYLKEIKAPQGYQLSSKVTTVQSNWKTATTTTTKSTERTEYTSKKAEAVNDTQIGWLKDNKFYAMDEFTAATTDVLPAYLKATTKTETSTTFTETNTGGSGVVQIENIKNTKLGELPSTGSIGTYLFTIAGVALIVFAGYVLMRDKKQKANK